ncbi:MAG: hypothetical protein PHV82_18155 [Victivallaceae bacterium]|nr:hypothetical protein [Victivallaceae bacterium]
MELQLKNISSSVSIQNDWLKMRDEILLESKAVTAIAGQQDYTNAEFVLKKVTGHSNNLESKRLELARPFNDAASQIKALADKERAELESEKARLKKAMARWVEEQERKRREQEEAAARLAAAEAEKRHQAEEAAAVSDDPFGDAARVPEPAPAIKPVTAAPFKMVSSSRIVYEFTVVNPNLVPREFCSVDESKIRAYVNLHKDAAQIEGVEIKKVTKIQSR